jgi:hypothetical protein
VIVVSGSLFVGVSPLMLCCHRSLFNVQLQLASNCLPRSVLRESDIFVTIKSNTDSPTELSIVCTLRHIECSVSSLYEDKVSHHIVIEKTETYFPNSSNSDMICTVSHNTLGLLHTYTFRRVKLKLKLAYLYITLPHV